MSNQEQIAFFRRLVAALPQGYNYATELADILQVSTDSIYRRARGETVLTYPEMLLIQQRLNLKLGVLFPHTHIEEINFAYSRPTNGKTILDFLEEISDQMFLAYRREKLAVALTGDDLPFFMHFLTPKLLQFKLATFSDGNFSKEGRVEEPDNYLNQLMQTILTRWLESGSDEVWGSAPLDSSIKQIHYSLENGLISQSFAAELMQELFELVDLINDWACTGKKNFGTIKGGKIALYHSELSLGDMNLILRFGDEMAVYKNSYAYGYMRTEHPDYCRQTWEWIKLQQQKSTLITSSGEKFRNRYIAMMKDSLNKGCQSMGLNAFTND